MRMSRLCFLVICILCQTWATFAVYSIIREYSGTDFFSAWTYYNYWDDTTGGDVNFLDQSDATAQRLTYVNTAGNAILKVDNTSTVANTYKRSSVRITSTDFYDVGSIWVIDALHLPYGCSVWPSFWTWADNGALWPTGGEIDIIEYVNLMGNNQMSLHSNSGCTQTSSPGQSGRLIQSNCNATSGCSVAETKTNSFGGGFAQAGGGVFAAQFDVAGIFIWFWSRPNVPASITQATSTSSIDPSTWGTPSASYPTSGCNIAEFFAPQRLVLDITLCGNWANGTGVYNATCHTTPTGYCYEDNVRGPGSPTYDNAYFEIQYIRAYSVASSNSSSSAPGSGTGTPTSHSAASTAKTTTTSPSSDSPSSGASSLLDLRMVIFLSALLLLFFGLS